MIGNLPAVRGVVPSFTLFPSVRLIPTLSPPSIFFPSLGDVAPAVTLALVRRPSSLNPQPRANTVLLNPSGTSPMASTPWIILGDFNCCRYEAEKAGGLPLSIGRLGELNNVIFYCGVLDLASVGLFFTWFNQRIDLPIHIKLDRVLVNTGYLEVFPQAFYKVLPPMNSDHSPLVLHSSTPSSSPCQFQFKNLWYHMEGFWDVVLDCFSSSVLGSPVATFYSRLQLLKRKLKGKTWASSNFISNALLELKNAMQKSWVSWISQRAKAYWLTNGEDDLGFLYAKIRSRHNSNMLREISTPEGVFSSQTDVVDILIRHFKGSNSLSSPLPILLPTRLEAPSCLRLVANLFLNYALVSFFMDRLHNTTSPATSWFRSKFSSPWKPTPTLASKFWNSVYITALKVKSHFRMAVSPYSDLSIWWDPWCNGLYLVDLHPFVGSNSLSSPLPILLPTRLEAPSCLRLVANLFLNYALVSFFMDRLHNTTSPATSWFRSKFSSPWKPTPTLASKFWNSVYITALKVKSHFRMAVSPYSDLSIWWDPWCNGLYLVDLHPFVSFGGPLVKDYVSNNCWDLSSACPDSVTAPWLRG
ncbi:hypothetical protein M5K25_009542 [Dendrobium thyrsiflorum]|uniref:Uncharacterized protein n=1 Tax=Dendrobium thyrsiflorum TaxID=117978 RepID=A0ABD0VCS4_DENTH